MRIVLSTDDNVPSRVMIVPVPLSESRMQERGFNQSLALAEMLDAPVKQVLRRKSGEKQAEKE